MKAEANRFITFEGVDGAGKSTHLTWFVECLAAATGDEVVLTREPGGTPLGEELRAIVLQQPMHLETEALLMFAARRQHIEEVIRPALGRGAWVVCDRFTDSTYAYQGAGRGLAREKLDALRDWVQADLAPVLTFLFDLNAELAQQRMAGVRNLDRFELEAIEFHRRVRAEYRRLAAAEPRRFRIIDSRFSIENIRARLSMLLSNHLRGEQVDVALQTSS